MNSEQFAELRSLILNNVSLNQMAALGGTKIYNDTSPHTGLSVNALQFRESSTITTLSGVDPNGDVVNFVTEFNISGVTLGTVDLLIVPKGYKITTITLATGSVLAYS